MPRALVGGLVALAGVMVILAALDVAPSSSSWSSCSCAPDGRRSAGPRWAAGTWTARAD